MNESEEQVKMDPLEELQKKLQECEEKYLRTLAEAENGRKRMQKERTELMQYAIENALAEILIPLDHFQKALSFAESGPSVEVKNWAFGFEMIVAQFKQVLANHGIEEYSSIGHHFNPHLHEAVEMVESSEHKPGTIIEEFTRGYKKGDRAVRVARVKVTKTPEEKNVEEKEGEKHE